MKTLLIATSGIIFATSVMAQVASIDTDGDGVASLAEIQAAMPEVTAEVFAAIDTSGDGVVDDAEMAAAQEVGLLPS